MFKGDDMDENLNYDITDIILEANESKENKDYLTALNKFDEALFFLEGQDKIDTLFSIADLHSEMGNYQKAKLVYENIINLEPENSGAWYGLAYSNELAGGDIESTLNAYEKAIKYDNEYKEAYYYASIIYGDRNNYKKAMEYLKKVIELNPEDFIAYNDLGSIYETLNDYKKAEFYLKKSISINENYHLSHFNLGVVYKAMGMYDDAIREYKKASELQINRNPYLNMSALYIEINELEKAMEILTEGVEKIKDHILYYNRACIYRKMGNLEKALEDFKKAKEIDPIVLKWAKEDPDLMDIIVEE